MESVVVRRDWALSLEVFVYLQLLDAATTLLGLRLGIGEASPFICWLMQFGPLAGLLGAKLIAVLLGGICVRLGRFGVIRWINYWYAALVLWNLALILSH